MHGKDVNKLIEIVIITHGNLAKEFENTIKLFVSTEHIKTLTLNPHNDLGVFREDIESTLFESDIVDTLVLVDLFGGTPFNTVVKLCNENSNRNKKIEILSGVNLSMVLEAALNMEDKSLEEVKNIALAAGKNGIRDFYSELKRKEGV
jgi:mannose PTS system EIIA component